MALMYFSSTYNTAMTMSSFLNNSVRRAFQIKLKLIKLKFKRQHPSHCCCQIHMDTIFAIPETSRYIPKHPKTIKSTKIFLSHATAGWSHLRQQLSRKHLPRRRPLCSGESSPLSVGEDVYLGMSNKLRYNPQHRSPHHRSILPIRTQGPKYCDVL